MSSRRPRVTKPAYPFLRNDGSPQACQLAFWYVGSPTGAGKMFDLGKLNNHGTLATNSGTAPSWAPGKDGGMAVSFAGSAGNRVVPARAFGITGNVPVTVAAWVLFTNAPGVNEVICNFGADVANQEVFFARITTGKLYIEFGGGAGAATGATTLVANTWYHVAGVYNGANNFVYVNGKLDGSNGYSLANLGNTQFSLGSYLNAGTYQLQMTGRIDELRIYTRPCAASEIFSMYDAPSRWNLRFQPGRAHFSSASTSPPLFSGYVINQAVKAASIY